MKFPALQAQPFSGSLAYFQLCLQRVLILNKKDICHFMLSNEILNWYFIILVSAGILCLALGNGIYVKLLSLEQSWYIGKSKMLSPSINIGFKEDYTSICLQILATIAGPNLHCLWKEHILIYNLKTCLYFTYNFILYVSGILYPISLNCLKNMIDAQIYYCL